MKNDRRYSVIEFDIYDLNSSLDLECRIRTYAKWYIQDRIKYVDLHDPRSFENIIDWIVPTVITNLKRGWFGNKCE